MVLFEARSGSSAIREGTREAEQYCAGLATINMYGQKVVAELLRHAEAYEVDSEPSNGVEVFSALDVTQGESAGAILRRKTGKETDVRTARMFIAAELAERLF